MGKGRPDPDRIWKRLDATGICWLWTLSTNEKGYGRINWNGRPARVHRLVYEILVGPIPDGLQLDHLCRVRHCCNPDHLEPVDARTNQLRGNGVGGTNARKGLCKRGHPLSGDNLRIRSDAAQAYGRECRQCRRDYHAANSDRINAQKRERRRRAKE